MIKSVQFSRELEEIILHNHISKNGVHTFECSFHVFSSNMNFKIWHEY